ncbi:MAG: DUF4403 family protein [Saprospiraceae bacterium]|nr:DUF4403 family protein [Saprospiraceae bacterium]
MSKTSYKGIGIQFPKDTLQTMIFDVLTKHLQDETFETGGFVLQCSVAGHQAKNLSAFQQSLRINLPVELHFSKPEGLFTVEGKGGIMLELLCTLIPKKGDDVFVDLQVENFTWFSSPVVTLGSMDIPVEWMADVVLKRIREHHLEKWVAAFNQSFDIEGMLTSFQEKKTRNIPVSHKPDIYFNFEIKQIVFVGFQDENHVIRIFFYIHYEALLSDKLNPFAPQKIVFSDKTITEVLDTTPFVLQINLSYEGLERWIIQYLSQNEVGGKSFDVEKAVIRNTSAFETKLFLRSPIQGSVTVSTEPFYDSGLQRLDLTNIKVDVSANQFFYQLTSPIIQRIIRNRIEEISPVNLQPLIEKAMVHFIKTLKQKGFDTSIKHKSIHHFGFETQACRILIHIDSFEFFSQSQGIKVYSL